MSDWHIFPDDDGSAVAAVVRDDLLRIPLGDTRRITRDIEGIPAGRTIDYGYVLIDGLDERALSIVDAGADGTGQVRFTLTPADLTVIGQRARFRAFVMLDDGSGPFTAGYGYITTVNVPLLDGEIVEPDIPPPRIEAITLDSDDLVFTRASLRTHPRWLGQELAIDVPVVERAIEAVPVNPRVLDWGDGLRFVGTTPDGDYVFSGDAGTFLSPDGLTAPTLFKAYQVQRIGLDGAWFTFGSTPSEIRRRAWNNLDVESAILITFENGNIGGQGVSGGIIAKAAGGTWATYGSRIRIGAYSIPQASWEIYGSDDHGVTWAKVHNLPENASTHIHALWYDHTGTLWMCVGDGQSNGGNTGMYRSTDHGVTFTKLAGSLGSGQPISIMTFGDRIVWGGDETPLNVYSCKLDGTDLRTHYLDRWDVAPLGYEGAGPIYDMAVVDGWLVVCPSQGHEGDWHNLIATRNLREWYPIASAVNGWGQPFPLRDGGCGFKRQGGGTVTGNFVAIDGIELVERRAIRVDQNVEVRPLSTTPGDPADWNFFTGEGEWVEGAGPNGERMAKLGKMGMIAAIAADRLPVTPGVPFEIHALVNNPDGVGLSGAEDVQVVVEYYDGAGVFITNDARGLNIAGYTPEEFPVVRCRFTPPANAVTAGYQFSHTGFVYNAATKHGLVGLPVAVSRVQVEYDTHQRADEAFSLTRSVDASWAVFTRCYPAWESDLITDLRPLLRIENAATGEGMTLQLNGATKLIELAQDGQSLVVGPEIRSYGAFGTRGYRPGATGRAVRFAQDGISVGFSVQSGVVRALVWERQSMVVTELVPLVAWVASAVRIEVPPESNAAHALTFADGVVGAADLPPLLLAGHI